MHPLLRAVAERRGGVSSAVDAHRAGYGPDEVQRLCASGRWHRLRRGIYTTSAVLDRAAEQGRRHELECLAVLLALDRPAAALSHGTAVRLHGLPSNSPRSDVVRLTDPAHNRRGRGFQTQARNRARPPLARRLWEEKRREDELRALGIAVVRIADADLGSRWPLVEDPLRRLLGRPRQVDRRFTATARLIGVPRTG